MVKKTATATKLSSMAELLKSVKTVTPKLRKGSICDGKIVVLSKKEALFDIGWKTQAVLIQPETKELTTFLPYLKVGDTLPVRIISIEARAGFPVVSLQSFFEKGKWDILKKNFEKEEAVEVNVIGSGKGGLFIEIMGIRGVIPKIQLTQNYLTEPQQLYGKKIKVKILEVEKSKNRLVVSQKAAALGITQSKLTKAFEEIKEGQVVECRVIGFSEFGIFCEVNGIEGLIHISEISWKKVTNPADYAKQNDILKAVVLQKNDKDFKLTLSLKRLETDPWEKIEEKYPKDKEVTGMVIRKEAYGYFVRLEPGVEGLIHNSKLPSETKIEINKEIKAYVERIDKKHRKMSLVLMSTEKPLLYR
jgi:ribosomal protein S1